MAISVIRVCDQSPPLLEHVAHSWQRLDARKGADERHGSLTLKGSSAKCGYDVARLVETSKVDSSGNGRLVEEVTDSRAAA